MFQDTWHHDLISADMSENVTKCDSRSPVPWGLVSTATWRRALPSTCRFQQEEGRQGIEAFSGHYETKRRSDSSKAGWRYGRRERGRAVIRKPDVPGLTWPAMWASRGTRRATFSSPSAGTRSWTRGWASCSSTSLCCRSQGPVNVWWLMWRGILLFVGGGNCLFHKFSGEMVM